MYCLLESADDYTLSIELIIRLYTRYVAVSAFLSRRYIVISQSLPARPPGINDIR